MYTEYVSVFSKAIMILETPDNEVDVVSFLMAATAAWVHHPFSFGALNNCYNNLDAYRHQLYVLLGEAVELWMAHHGAVCRDCGETTLRSKGRYIGTEFLCNSCDTFYADSFGE